MAPFFLAYGLVGGAYIGTEALATVMTHVTKLSVYGGYALIDLSAGLAGVLSRLQWLWETFDRARLSEKTGIMVISSSKAVKRPCSYPLYCK